MSERSVNFPFTAVIGLETVKKALICLAVNDNIKGVLIRGPAGTAKSVISRSFSDILGDRKIINIPVNITDEQLFGGLDIETAVSGGRTVLKEGLLRRADGNILYIDNVNLFDRKKLNMILDCIESGIVIVEREGISATYACHTSIIATMDPIEQELDTNLSDRFDICVHTTAFMDKESRSDIIRADIEYRDDPVGFTSEYAEKDSELSISIEESRERLLSINIDENAVSTVTDLCIGLDVIGHRGDIATVRTASTLSAISGNDGITHQNISDAAVMCLGHRRRKVEEKEEEDAPSEMKRIVVEEPVVDDVDDMVLIDEPENTTDTETPEPEERTLIEEVSDKLWMIDEIESLRLHDIAGVNTKRKDLITSSGNGRYSGSKIPKGRSRDPAFDATIRAAAPYQISRDKGDLSIAIEPQDIRDKIRTKRDSSSFLFLVDMSGSLVNSKMIDHMNNAIRAMLKESYVKRDRVALMTFNKYDTYLLVPFTRSVETVYGELERAPRGDNTPLNLALLTAREYITTYLNRNPEERCYVFVITDGETTKSAVPGATATTELRRICSVMDIPRTEWIVIDSKLGFSNFNNARRLAKLLNAKYYTLDQLSDF